MDLSETMERRLDREALRSKAAALAGRGVYVGTSSWKYPGWRGLLYDEGRYVWKGRFAEARFKRYCLTEYAEVFKTVGVDAAYYTFPTRAYLEGMVSQVPADFRFGFKVTDEITVKRFGNLARFGPRAGQPNANFLNAELFNTEFLGPCEAFRGNIGLLMFEFSHFYPGDYAHGREFLADLEGFLAKLPRGWPYGVEIRNKSWLRPEYFAVLARHGVAHIFNNWTNMPPVGDQLNLTESRTAPALCGARFLLQPGRTYEQAVELLSPYNQVRDPDPEARAAGARLIQEGKGLGDQRPTYIYVNNRLEGNALDTIDGMIDLAG